MIGFSALKKPTGQKIRLSGTRIDSLFLNAFVSRKRHAPSKMRLQWIVWFYIITRAASTPVPDHEFDFRHCGTSQRQPYDLYDESIVVTMSEGTVCSKYGVIFDGNSVVSLTPWEFGGDFSFELFIKLSSNAANFCRVVDFGDAGSDNDIFTRLSNGNFQYVVRTETASKAMGDTAILDNWMHVVATSDSTGSHRIYMDGTQVGSKSTLIIPTLTRATHVFGKCEGILAYVRFWNEVELSETEVAELFLSRINPTPSPTRPPTHYPTSIPTTSPSPAPTPEPSETVECSIERCTDLQWNSDR